MENVVPRYIKYIILVRIWVCKNWAHIGGRIVQGMVRSHSFRLGTITEGDVFCPGKVSTKTFSQFYIIEANLLRQIDLINYKVSPGNLTLTVTCYNATVNPHVVFYR